MSDTLQQYGRINGIDKRLTHCALGDKAKHLNGLRLPQAMGAIHGLQIDLWIPIATQGEQGKGT